MPRLFLALALPATIRAALTATYDLTARHVVWTPTAQLHLTLRFLGNLDETRVPELIASLAQIRVAAFLLTLAGVGTFPPRGQPLVLWAGVGHAHPHLFQLRQQIDDRLLTLGLPVDLRTFHPHATVARLHHGASTGFVAQWLRHQRAWEAPPFQVEHLGLYASELHPTGARHTLVHTFPLVPAL